MHGSNSGLRNIRRETTIGSVIAGGDESDGSRLGEAQQIELARCASEPDPDTEPHVTDLAPAGGKRAGSNRPKLQYPSMEDDCTATRNKRDQSSAKRLLVLLHEHHDFNMRIPMEVIEARKKAALAPKRIKPKKPVEAIAPLKAWRQKAHDVKIFEIKRAVAYHFGISVEDLISPIKTNELVRPRQIAFYLSKNHTGRSYPEIGYYFGGRDHTTILHGYKKIERLLKTDQELRRHIESVEGML